MEITNFLFGGAGLITKSGDNPTRLDNINLAKYIRIFNSSWQNAVKEKDSVTDLDRPRGLQEVTVPRFHDNGTGCW